MKYIGKSVEKRSCYIKPIENMKMKRRKIEIEAIICFLLICMTYFTAGEDLYMCTSKKIKIINTDSWNETTILSKENSQFLGFAVDLGDAKIYYADVADDTLGIYRMDLNDSSTESRIISYNQMTPVGLAVDWVFKHLYWTDMQYRSAMVSNLDGSSKITLATEGLSMPRGIAVEPDNMKLYIGDQGVNKILQCDLDGRNCQHLQFRENDLMWPNQIMINYNDNKLYWTEGCTTRVISCNLDGTKCRRDPAVSERNMSLFGMTSTQTDSYYLSSMFNQTQCSVNITVIREMNTVNEQISVPSFLISSNIPVHQPSVSTQHPCVYTNHSCGGICLPSTGNVATCTCPSASGKLASENGDCEDPSEFLLYTNVRSGEVGISNPKLGFVNTLIKGGVVPLGLAYDPVKQDVYFSDAKVRAIYSCKLDGSEVRVLLNSSHGINYVEGLAIDFKQRRLYFTNTGYSDKGDFWTWGNIEMVDLQDVQKRRRILRNLHKPRSIVIHSDNRTLYYMVWGETNPHVGRVRLDGYNRQTLYEAVNPKGMTILGGRLYVTDSPNHTSQSSILISSDLDGSNRVDISISEMGNIYSISKFENNLLITDSEGRTGIYSTSGVLQSRIQYTGYTDMLFTKRSKDIQEDQGLCNTNICSDICVTTTNYDFPTCLCSSYSFHHLQRDRQTCSRPSSSILFADVDGIMMVPLDRSGDDHIYNIIPSSSVCGDFHGLAKDDNNIYFSSYYGQTIFRASLDGSDVVEVYKTDHKLISIAIYRGTLYWTGITDIKSKKGGIFSTSISRPATPPEEVVGNLDNPYFIIVTKRYVSWFDRDIGVIKSKSTWTTKSGNDIIEMNTDEFPKDRIDSLTMNNSTVATDKGLKSFRFRSQNATRKFVWFDDSIVFTEDWQNRTYDPSLYRYDILHEFAYLLADHLVRSGQLIHVGEQLVNLPKDQRKKPGSCPLTINGINENYYCTSDFYCIGKKKCCPATRFSYCVDPIPDSVCEAGNFTLLRDATEKIQCQICTCVGQYGLCRSEGCLPMSCPRESQISFPGDCCTSCISASKCSGKPKFINVSPSVRDIPLPNGTRCMKINLINLNLTHIKAISCSGKSLEINLDTEELCWKKLPQVVKLISSDRQGSTVAKVRVKLKDITPPTIESCPVEGIKVTKRLKDTKLPVTWQPIIVYDNIDVKNVTIMEKNGLRNGQEFQEGTTNVEYRIFDGNGNGAFCNFAVVVECGMDFNCPNPQILHNGYMSCYISSSRVTCEIFRCYDGYWMKERTPKRYVCDSNGEWGPVDFPARFTTETCFKTVPSILNLEFSIQLNCSNAGINDEDIVTCLEKSDLNQLREIGTRIIYDHNLTTISQDKEFITKRVTGTLERMYDQTKGKYDIQSYGPLHWVRGDIGDFFRNGDFERRCFTLACEFLSFDDTEEVSLSCPRGATVRIVQGERVCAKCAPGSRFEDGECHLCDADSYQERAGQDTCIKCPDGTNSEPGAFLIDQCRSSIINITKKDEVPLNTTIWTIVGVLISVLLVAIIVVIIVRVVRAKKSVTYNVPPVIQEGAQSTVNPEDDVEYALIGECQMSSPNEIAAAIRGRERRKLPSIGLVAENDPYATVKDDQDSHGGDNENLGANCQSMENNADFDPYASVEKLSDDQDVNSLERETKLKDLREARRSTHTIKKEPEINPYESSMQTTAADDHDYKRLGGSDMWISVEEMGAGANRGEDDENGLAKSLNPYETTLHPSEKEHEYWDLKGQHQEVTKGNDPQKNGIEDPEHPLLNVLQSVTDENIKRLSSSGSSSSGKLAGEKNQGSNGEDSCFD